MVNPHLPQPTTLRCLRISIEPDRVTIAAESLAPFGTCPLCGGRSTRRHSRYWRQLGDLPWQGQSVRLRLRSQKFFCDVLSCPRRIFTERLIEVAHPHARNTLRLAGALASIAFACGGEAGSRLAGRLGMAVSPDTLLRTIRRTPIAPTSSFRILGVDDWAVRKGQRYGTLICDHEQHRPIDLLDDREPETLSAWLQQHPGIEVITRDRAHCYTEAATQGAPQALQVADRFHLMQNLRQAITKMVDHRHEQLKSAMKTAASRAPQRIGADQQEPVTVRVNRLPRRPTLHEAQRNRRHERYERVVDLHRQGMSQRGIARQLGIHRETVGRYIQAGELPDRAKRKYASKTDQFTDYLVKRWSEGCHNAAELYRELQNIGFAGSYCSVRRRVATWDRGSAGPSVGRLPAPQPPSARRTAWLLLKDATDIGDERDRAFVNELLNQCPEIAAATKLAREFAAMVRGDQDTPLGSWIRRAWAHEVPREIRAFATGLKSDFSAVNAGLTTAWSNGQLEGQVNRLKLIKRQMYGRANFDLLKKRVLYTG